MPNQAPPTRERTPRPTLSSVIELLTKGEESITQLDVEWLRRYLNGQAKMGSAYKNGFPLKVQRRIRRLIIRARFLALLPYTGNHRRNTQSLMHDDEAEVTPAAPVQ